MIEYENFKRGWTQRPLVSKIQVGDVLANVDLSVDRPEIRVENLHLRNSPAARDALTRELDEAGGKMINLIFRLKHDARLAQVGWLRSAYIIAFAALGYTYILQPALDIVRRQFQDPDSNLIEKYVGVLGDDAGSAQRLGLTRDPARELDVVVVQVGARAVILPGFNPDIDIYGELARSSTRDQFSSMLTEVPWPSEPTHSLDFGEPLPDYVRLELRSRPPHRVKVESS